MKQVNKFIRKFNMNFVIIGGGIAGTTAAQELRKLNSDAEITIIEQEPHRLYSKVLLARYITNELERERLFLKNESWYTENRIELMSGVRVLSIDSINKHVKTSDGRELPYDKLLIASGQEPKLVDSNCGGVAYLRTLDDAEHLKQLIAKLKVRPVEEQGVIVAGGSFVSCELLHICQKLGIKVSVVLRSSGFWSKSLSKESQDIITNKASELGIDIYTKTGFEIIGSDELLGIKLDDGTQIKAGILALGIGLEADLSWLEGSGVKTDIGVLCDDHLQTSIKDIYASGDIAQFNDCVLGRNHLVANWTNAIEQAMTVSKNMSHEDSQYRFVSSYATRLGDLEITFIGDTQRSEADTVSFEQKDNTTYEFFVRKDCTVGAVILGSAKNRKEITKAIFDKILYTLK
jgi:NAD(P)H-nitrite reductase large subunit